MLVKVFGKKDLDLHLTRIKECVKYPNLINVYELDGQEGVSNGIDSAILNALIKAKKGNFVDQLQLALVWNRADVAQREIFYGHVHWEKGELDNFVRYAIVHNLPEFLDLFIEKGVSMKDYLTDRELTVLYNKVSAKFGW
ncbi:Transient receptor potential cation channel subfamily M member 5 [Holothuria leucospilota]|uniref:Transient receptor potential cation channel subfamily M member 5 n=1 Tax=Holothuria leucospilota TaxID=206669 RepID=A0A9Q1C1I2_HOLLE|nr:Transient receptor potential cation channel subfamily M member 5 [Holothuria leucospilota]